MSFILLSFTEQANNLLQLWPQILAASLIVAWLNIFLTQTELGDTITDFVVRIAAKIKLGGFFTTVMSCLFCQSLYLGIPLAIVYGAWLFIFPTTILAAIFKKQASLMEFNR